MEDLEPMRARSIGPAGMSGRVAAVDVSPSDRNVIFVGAATGGVWRSLDGGLDWSPVFDDQPVQGIGAVAVSPANSDVIWVGTGEGNPRNSAGVGNGVYRSVDGGKTWTHLGLERSERIHRIIPHPDDPDVAFVAAMGPAWSDGGERGVYKTEDGGGSWTRVLHVNERTGAADLVMDPSNPRKLFAAMWEYRRWPWFFQSGGEGSGLYVTYDGGRNWEALSTDDGLPDGPLGRIGLGIASSAPNVVYALVEATRSALLRSEDGGRTWRPVTDRPGIAPRPFYYADIRVDPHNENRIYSLHGSIEVSEDGGLTFRTVVPSRIIHGDVHELWIDPDDSRRMIMGNDGGIAFTSNRGAQWRFVENLPLAQFYHINVDMEVPFHVYGGLQDNGSWHGPSTVWESRGIANAHWRRVGGGDGFATLNDFGDPRYGYSMSQQGNLMRFDKITGERRDIQPVHPDGTDLRFNWNAALNVDPHDSTTIYLGSQFVHRSRDHGATWEVISPDLTTNDPEKQCQNESGGLTLDATGAENHTTIVSIAPSPVDVGLIWVGTDDGNVQITRDDGATWANVADRIPDVPQATWVPHIEPSKHDGGAAYVVFDDHRRGNWTPFVFRTEDYGRSWSSLVTPEVSGFVHVLEEDPVEPNLLFLGTELGMYVSLDRGRSWMKWIHGLPSAPIRALMVHPRDHDLVIGTHGRAVFILDDIRPLRALAGDAERASSALFVPPLAPAQEYVTAEGIGYRSTGHAMFFGEPRPYGALIHYWLGAEAQSVTVEIRDLDGSALRTLEGPGERGLNRVIWDLRREATQEAGEGDLPGGTGSIEVLPGDYAVRVIAGEHEAGSDLRILPDPRSSASLDERRAKVVALETVSSWIALAGEARQRLESALEGVDLVLERLEQDQDDLRREGSELRESLREELEELFVGPTCQGICGRGETRVAPVRSVYGRLSSSRGAPTPNDRSAMGQAEAALREIVDRVNEVLRAEVAAFRETLESSGFTLFPELEPLRFPAQGG
jgi:photosystem II stability/assembly factor-like uncharacterized protein